MSLKKQALTGVKWTTAASVINSVVQLVQLAILAGLLDASDFGLMALVMVVIGFSQMFIDMGLSNAVIYKQKITIEQLSSLYWLNIIIGLLFFILLIIASPLISNIYENQKLTPLINLVAATFLIKPWGQQFMVLLQKNMRFNAIAKTEIISRFISFIVVIVLAYKNFGVYSLAIGSIVFAVFSTIGYNFYGRNLYRPKFYLNIKLLKDFLSFGLFQMGEKIITYFSSQFDTILIGKLLGLEVLGIYNVAKNLVSKPSGIINPVITKVTFPIMSKIDNNITQLKNVFLKTVSYLSLVNFPVHFLIALLAEPLIIIMFGDEWIQAIPIVRVLSFVFLLRSIGNPAGSLLLSRGRADIAFYWGLGKFIFYPIFIVVGSYWNINGVTLSILILHLIIYFLNWHIIVLKTCYAGLSEYFKAIKKPLLFSLLPTLLILLVSFIQLKVFIFTSISIILFSILYLFAFIKFDKKSFYEFKTMILNKS